MTPTISLSGLTRRYRDHLALDDVTVDVTGPSITGLLGRNGAGKTTLMRIVAGQELPSAGTVRVLGANPVQHEDVLRRMLLLREDQVYPDISVRHVLRVASWCCPNWDAEFADSLLRDFALPTRRRVNKLSRGMRSALAAVIGLAARAEVTLFDEPTAGLDAVARQLFYDRMLADYTERPRTIVLSTHLIDEVADLLERVVVLDSGRVVLDASADDLRGTATRVSGPTINVREFVAGRQSWGGRSLGSQTSVIVTGELGDQDRLWARQHHLSLQPLSLQQFVVHSAGNDKSDMKETTSA